MRLRIHGVFVPLVVSGVAVALLSCGSASPRSRGGPASGVEAKITLGSLCPVARQVVTCPDHPFAARVEVLNASGRQVGDTIRSDDGGRLRVDLAPGAYTLVPLNPQPNVPPAASPVKATVVPGQYSVVTIRYDTGIR